jgi:hypothetical protein
MPERIVVADELGGVRADAGLAKLMGISRSLAATLIAEGNVLSGGKPMGKSAKLAAGDVLHVTVPERRDPSRETPRSVRTQIMATADTTAESATLKIAKFGSWMKSTTWPIANDGSRNSLSVRLPSAPPRRRPSASAHQADPSLRTWSRMAMETPAMMMENTHVTFSPMENAAPEFRMKYQCRRGGSTGMRSPSTMVDVTQSLVSWSSA